MKYMDKPIKTKLTKKNKIKPELIIIEEESPKNKTLKLSPLKRCKKGTIRYKPLGSGCYNKTEIENYKLTNKIKKTRTKTKKAIELEIIDKNPIKIIETKKTENKRLIKRSLKTPIELEIMEEKKRYNEEFIDLMEKLNTIMSKQGEPFRARAYQKAQETLMAYPDDIYTTSQLKGKPGIGPTIIDKLDEYIKTGTLRVLEKEKTNPINILSDIYGVGPKKAQELVDANIKTIDELRTRQDELLNDTQKIGLKYYEQILERIPRTEIEQYEKIFTEHFDKVAKNFPDSKFEIVGSYRRGAQTSGDIDVIITGKTGGIYNAFVDELLKTKIILEVLSRGSSKTLVIAKLPGLENTARRIDFLYSPPNEFPFAILYFTGSKAFNTVMRQYALDKGYTFNEHGIYKLENKKKGAKIEKGFKTEKDIFDFLGLQFKTPIERRDGRDIIPYTDVGENKQGVGFNDPTLEVETEEIIPVKKNTTLKKRKPSTKPKVELEIIDDNETIVSPSETEIVEIIEQFKHNGIKVLEQLNEKQLGDIIRIANSKYYNQTPIMTDNQYDIIKEFIEHKFPDNAIVTEIGAEVERNKVKLPYEMGSMDKIKPDTGALSLWMSKYKGPYVLSCKLDGVSGLYTTEGTKPKLYTRGNGKVGQDISHLIPFLRLPKTKGVVIRGEFIIPKKVFDEKYGTIFANPRNMVAGIINHKHISDAINDLHFVA